MNTLNCKNKSCEFTYNGEQFKIDLTEGDLHDNWNGITLSNGEIKDFNFSWVENDIESKPIIVLYKVDSDNETDFFCYDNIVFDKIIGAKKQYFKK